MEDLFREILAPSPLLSASPLPIGVTNNEAVVTARPASATAGTPGLTPPEPIIEWEGEAEMQRLLDMLPDVTQDISNSHALDAIHEAMDEFPTTIDLGLPVWDLSSPSAISAF